MTPSGGTPAVSESAQGLTIARGSRALATVIVGSGGEEAASLLSEYVQKATGADLRCRHHQDPDEGDEAVRIHVGASPYVEATASGLEGLDEDGYVIQTPDALNLVVAGPTRWGTEHGVSEFLERFTGVRWLLPGPRGEHVPQLEELVIPVVDIRQEPAFLDRSQPGLTTDDHQDWGRRLRLRQRHVGSSHHLTAVFPPDRYRDEHPEFYPMVGGRRLLAAGWKWHPCFSAPGAAEEASRNIREHFRQHPEETTYSIAVNDGAAVCESEVGPPAWGNPNNNWLGNRHVSEHFFRWANRVAELVCDEFPDKWLGCLGYTNVFQAPSEVSVHPRIIVYHTYDRHKWIHPELERDGQRLAEAWRAACGNMAWYDYNFGATFMAPRVYFHHMGEYHRYGRDIGIMGINGESCHNWAEAPKYYLMARLYWDPDVDVDTVLAEWYELAVGPEAAPLLARYYSLWERFWTTRILDSKAFSLKGQQWLPIQNDTYFDVLDMADFVESRRLLEEVEARAGTEVQRERARMLIWGFEFYEASAQARLPDRDAGRSQLTSREEALQLLEGAAASAAAATRRRSTDAELSQDPVMVRCTVSWPATERSDWGVYPLWRAFEWIAADAELRGRVREMCRDGGDAVLTSHGELLLAIADRTAEPVQGVALRGDSGFRQLCVTDDSPLSFEPGDRMDAASWWLTVGDDVLPFWNPPHGGGKGQISPCADGGRQGPGELLCEGVEYGTVRRKYAPLSGKYTALGFVRLAADASTRGQVVLNIWEITAAGHNPSPFRTVVEPQVGVWTPVAVTGEIRPSDYVLLELAIEGYGPGDRLEVADLAMYTL